MSLTGANTTPLGRLHPILAAKQQGPASPTPGFKRDAGHSDMDFGGKCVRQDTSNLPKQVFDVCWSYSFDSWKIVH